MVRIRLLPLLAVLAAGCGAELPVPNPPGESEPGPPAAGLAFDPAMTGRVAGRVAWGGVIPETPGFLYGLPRPGGLGFEFRTAENPNRPRVHPKTKAVAGAVVFLRGIDPAAARPWDLPPVRVEVGNGRITVVQGDRRDRAGFVRRGDAFTAVSTEPAYHLLRGRGDAFFGLALPEPNSPATRTLTAPGRVELSSGTGQYWMRADLFVADHPYFAVTDADGRFAFEQVPAGKAEVVVWLPGWGAAKQERDPDSTSVARMAYSPPLERAEPVVVSPAGPAWVAVFVP